MTLRSCATATVSFAMMFAISGLSARADDWTDIRNDAFAGRPVLEAATSALTLYGPNQASNGALVPVSIHMPTATAMRAKKLTLVIDRNPAPIAATFEFGDAFRSGVEIGDRVLATRIRIDSFSNVRAVVETTDGELMMSSKFIAGAGGCSALPSKDLDQALASLGRLKVKLTTNPGRDVNWREGLVMLRHPNFTGMQMNPATGAYTPARYLSKLEVRYGDGLLFRMDGGISISEDPNLRFTFASSTQDRLVVIGQDTDGLQIAGHANGAGS